MDSSRSFASRGALPWCIVLSVVCVALLACARSADVPSPSVGDAGGSAPGGGVVVGLDGAVIGRSDARVPRDGDDPMDAANVADAPATQDVANVADGGGDAQRVFACDLLQQNCAAQDGCYPAPGGGTRCQRRGDLGEAAPCTPGEAQLCDRGFVCQPNGVVTTCQQLCSLTGGCRAGGMCLPLAGHGDRGVGTCSF